MRFALVDIAKASLARGSPLPTVPVMPQIHPVVLVGAGPGDPELLTLKAARAIARADVLLVDDLVDRRVLEHAPPAARVVQVGKRGGCPSTPQDFIERLLVREARAGHRVVRLKGGDPMIFGRAGEEIDALRQAGIPVEVVPGISAALGAAASLGLSLTDRRTAQGVAFVTGHARPGGTDPDWQALARAGLTLVVYMGVQRAGEVAQRLLEGGLPPATSALVIFGATSTQEARHPTCLDALAAGACPGGQGAPGLLIIGDVTAGLAAALRQERAATIPACDAA